MKVTVRNVYGYPSVSKRIREYAKENGFVLVLDRTGLLECDQLEDKVPKILLDNPALFVTNNVPIIGYSLINGVYYKCPLPHREQLEPNKRRISIPKTIKRLPTKVQLEGLRAPVKADWLATLSPEHYKIAKGLVNRFLPPSLNDKKPEKKECTSTAPTQNRRASSLVKK
jgi:hypothetical protein